MTNEEVLTKSRSLARKCIKHVHTLRTNKLGITWCIGCGLLATSMAPRLKENEKLIWRI